MIRIALLTLAVLALAGSPAGAELVTVPITLDGGTLWTSAGGTDDLPFDAGRSLENVAQVGLHVVATGRFGRSICWDFGDFGGGTWSYREDVGLTAGFRQDEQVVAAGEFVWDEDAYRELSTLSLDTTLLLEGADWSVLADGAGTLVLGGLSCAHDPSYPETCICDPSLEITTLELVIGLDGTIPAAPASWGALKSRYR